MATVCAVLHHKMDHFFWTGFYLQDRSEKLMVGPYQGPVACQELGRTKGFAGLPLTELRPVVVPMYMPFPVILPAIPGQNRKSPFQSWDEHGEIMSSI